jgi:RNA polymerase sigma factor (sigma-70 family)
LTHHGGDGKVYTRTALVENQIREALSLEREVLHERISIDPYTAPGFIKEECLVYLTRRFLRDGKHELASDVMNCLAKRIARRVHSQASETIHWSLVDDCCQNVLMDIAQRLTDLDTDRDDFAQSRFGLWLERVVYKALRPFHTVQKDTRAKQVEVEKIEQSNGNRHALQDEPLSPEQIVEQNETKRLRAQRAEGLLKNLEPDVREAYRLRHEEGMEIENKDPNVMTISKRFQRSPRTIQNWLKRAEEKLQQLQGGQQ